MTTSPTRRRHRGDLLDFPRPSVAVDIAVLTVTDADADAGGPALAALLLRRADGPAEGEWSLPGSFLRERETLHAAVLRTLADKCGITGLAPRQLRVFDDPHRDDRGWVLSVAHIDVVPEHALAGALAARDDLMLAPVALPPDDGPRVEGAAPARFATPGSPPAPVALSTGQAHLPFDHDAIAALAARDLRARYRAAPDPAALTPEPFTLLELRRTHEAVLGEVLQKDTFRRQVVPSLIELDRLSDGTVGRPARLYRRR